MYIFVHCCIQFWVKILRLSSHLPSDRVSVVQLYSSFNFCWNAHGSTLISACEGSFFWIFDASKIRQSFTFTNLLCVESSCNIFSTFLFCWCSKHWRKSTSDKPFEFPLHALRGSRVPNQIFKINPNFFNYIHQWTYFKCFFFQ